MKKYSVLLTTALVTTALLTGCSNDNTSEPQRSDVAISLTCSAVSAEGTISDMTRAGSSEHPTIASGEVISVYMPESSVTAQQTYTANADVSSNTVMTRTSESVPYFVAGKNTVNIYGFYPSSTTMNTTVSHTVNTDQSGETNYKASDLMFAKTSVTKAAQATVTGNLNFAHLMSKIIVNVSSTTNCTPTSIKILNVKKTVQFDPSSYTFSNSSIEGLSTSNPVGTTGITIGTATDCAGLIPAQTVDASTNLIEVTTAAGTATFALGNTAKTFYPGMTYTVTLTVNTAAIGVTSTITSWGTGDNTAENMTVPTPRGPVDLGLPSGTKWATMNVGATCETDYGMYFQWGDIIGYSSAISSGTTAADEHIFSWDTYKWNPTHDGSTFTKYTDTNSATLELSDDAARANWGGSWRMPTEAEWTELINNCTWTLGYMDSNGNFTKQSGSGAVFGFKITGNGNSIFLPAAGYRSYSSIYHQESYGCYWSSSLRTDNPTLARYLNFPSSGVGVGSRYRFYGYTVRPVQSAPPAGVEAVDLGLPSGRKWANMNVGATSVTEYGTYFAWGETEGLTVSGASETITSAAKTDFSWSTYKWGTAYNLTKYNSYSNTGTVDNKTTLESSDDAAYANWGGNWRMPTETEFQELIDNTTVTYYFGDEYYNGVHGVKLTSNNNSNYIFLPAAGSRGDAGFNNQGSRGNYWSSSLGSGYPGNAWHSGFDSSGVSANYVAYRCYGFPVRPVQ